MSEMVERVARALAERHGDNWDHLPNDKSHWTEMRGQFGGRFRDVNERYRCDYLDEASAAIEAMREPTDEQRNAYYELSFKTETMMDAHWERAIDAALNEKSPTAS